MEGAFPRDGGLAVPWLRVGEGARGGAILTIQRRQKKADDEYIVPFHYYIYYCFRERAGKDAITVKVIIAIITLILRVILEWLAIPLQVFVKGGVGGLAGVGRHYCQCKGCKLS